MYHPRFKGKHYDMGVKRGEIFKKCNLVFPLMLDKFQLAHGIESEMVLKEYFPKVCDEVKGICDVMQIEYEHFMSWMLAMGCCMYNLDGNTPEIRGCTAFAWLKEGRIIYGRNNDLPPFLKQGSKSELYAPDGENRFILTTSSFVNGEEGLNEHGLAVAMTFVLTRLDKIKAGFNSVFIVRYLLEKADSVESALKLLMELPVASNCNILLSDKSGEMIVVECSPTEKHIRKPIELENGKVICTVNSFTSEHMKKYEFTGEDTYNSDERYDVVINSIKQSTKEDMVLYSQKLLKGDYGFMCQYKKEQNFQTIWSSIFNLQSLMIYRAEGDPRKTKYIEDSRL